MENTIGSIPEFTPNEETGTEQVDTSTEVATEEVAETEKETPAEPVAVETPVEPEVSEPSVPNVDTGKQVQGLLQEREKLLKEIQSLRGQRREIKQEQLIKVEGKLDDLKDVNPDDVNLIEKVVRAKGLVTKDEAHKMFYEAVKQDEINKFLEKYPEYKPENDPHDLNWSAFEREVKKYVMPSDPHGIANVLAWAHRDLASSRPASDRGIPERTQRVKVAGVGSGGAQRSSSTRKSLDPETVVRLKDGGFTDEDIQNMEARL